MEILECGMCGSWRQVDLFPSGNNREGGKMPDDNFVCLPCQREMREMQEMERALDEYEKGRRRMRSQMRRLLPDQVVDPGIKRSLLALTASCAGHRTRGHCALSAMLTVSQLSKSFAGRALFDDVSLQVNRGDRIGA